MLTARRDPDLGENVGILFAIFDGSDPAPILARLRDGLPLRTDEVAMRSYPDVQAFSGRLPFGLRHY